MTREKKVLVLGGGPGGMQAAIIAAQKGHKVTLWEKGNALGGQLILAVIPPDKQDLGNFLTYLKVQVAKSGVKVVLNKEATPEAVSKFAPDSVIVAVGSTPFVLIFPASKGKMSSIAGNFSPARKKSARMSSSSGRDMLAAKLALRWPKKAPMSR